MPTRGHDLLAVVLGVTLFVGCAAGSSSSGARGARVRDWDGAVALYRQAVEEDPARVDGRIALARATLAASRHHLAEARRLEAKNALTEALTEYERALELDPSNRAILDARARIQRAVQAPTEPRRRVPPGRRESPPLLDPASSEPVTVQFVDASLRHILDTLGDLAGINVVYDAQFQDRLYSTRLEDVTLDAAFDQILSANGYFHVVRGRRSLRVGGR